MYETSLSSSPAHGRSNEEYMRMIQINPFAIQNIPNPSTEMKLAALRQNGLVLEFIENPTREMQVLALHNTAKAIQFIPNPPKEFLQQAIEQSWTNLAYVPNPPEWLIWKALEQSGWAIQYIENPSEDMQLQAVRKNYDAIRYIQDPTPKVQAEAAAINYTSLRYVKHPTFEAQCIAIQNDDQAIRLFADAPKEHILHFLSLNILVIRYLPREKLVTDEELKDVLRRTLSRDDVPEQYVRDFITCNRIETDYDWRQVDKLRIIHEYGSRRAKRIAVDEKLKIQ